MRTALITGINGQDGSYLAELLLEKGYNVCGILRRNSVAENQSIRINHILDKLTLFYGDLTDLSSLISIIDKCKPDEVYNLASQSHVRISFDTPIQTALVTGLGVLNVLEAIKIVNQRIKIYQASSSEMFGNSIDVDGYQRETTPMHPVSPYGCSKLFGYNICRNYRESYGMFISNGILFNHESPRRGDNFVSNKIVKAAVQIKARKINELKLGNLNATRDWGHAKDYVKGMWMMLQHNKADDFVCSTGVSHSVQNLVDYVFSQLKLDPNQYISIDPKYFRPNELNNLKGDYSKIKNTLGWNPEYTFETMLEEMVLSALSKYLR